VLTAWLTTTAGFAFRGPLPLVCFFFIMSLSPLVWGMGIDVPINSCIVFIAAEISAYAMDQCRQGARKLR
jgi:hypothetical protein